MCTLKGTRELFLFLSIQFCAVLPTSHQRFLGFQYLVFGTCPLLAPAQPAPPAPTFPPHYPSHPTQPTSHPCHNPGQTVPCVRSPLGPVSFRAYQHPTQRSKPWRGAEPCLPITSSGTHRGGVRLGKARLAGFSLWAWSIFGWLAGWPAGPSALA